MDMGWEGPQEGLPDALVPSQVALVCRLSHRSVSQVLSQTECWVEAISCVHTHLFQDVSSRAR